MAFPGGEFGLSIKVIVVFAVVGMETQVIELEACEGSEQRNIGPGRIIEDLCAKYFAKVDRISGALQPGNDFAGPGIGHLVGRQQGKGGLLVQCVETPVPAEAAGWRFISFEDAFGGIGDELLVPGWRAIEYVAQGGNCACALAI